MLIGNRRDRPRESMTRRAWIPRTGRGFASWVIGWSTMCSTTCGRYASGPSGKSPPEAVRARMNEPLPRAGQGPEKAYRDFVEGVLPYPTGNIHPRFWGWVIGTGTPFTALAEMLAATVNPNVSGFDDGASLVEDRVLAWLKEAMGFPASASGLLVSGGSMANLVGLAVARHTQASFDVRRLGQGAAPRRMVLYASRRGPQLHQEGRGAARPRERRPPPRARRRRLPDGPLRLARRDRDAIGAPASIPSAWWAPRAR